jgi:hypothetical protein
MQNESKHHDDAKHQEIIPRKHREIFCNKQGCGRYNTNWIFGWPAVADKSVFIKTDADRNLLKRMK